MSREGVQSKVGKVQENDAENEQIDRVFPTLGDQPRLMSHKKSKIQDYFSAKQRSVLISSHSGASVITSEVGVESQQKWKVTQKLYKEVHEIESLRQFNTQKNQSTTEEISRQCSGWHAGLARLGVGFYSRWVQPGLWLRSSPNDKSQIATSTHYIK